MNTPLRPAVAAAVALLATFAALAALLVGACGAGSEPGTPQTGSSPTSTTPTAPGVASTSGPTVPMSPGGTPTSTSTGGAVPAGHRALPIYYVVDTRAGLRLYREFHSVPRTDDPATDAVRELFARAVGTDPDYRSYWPAGTRLRGAVGQAGGVITVDLNAEATQASLGSEAADRTVAQLVYTVQGALQSTDPVRILIEGQRVELLWGHVPVGEPVGRGDPYQIRSLVQIDQPAHGATVGRTFEVSGEAGAPFEGNVPWEILRDGHVIKSGFTMADSMRFSAFRFSVTLEPGEYTLRVSEDDASGGEGRPPLEDTKLIRVEA